jgi:hypothetical protein
MQFIVPQFIDIEPKIIGPITPRQFIILIITGTLIFLAYKLSDFTLFVIEAVILFALGGTLAFLKINGRPVHYFLLNVIETLKRPSLRIWRKEPLLERELKIKEEKIELPPPPTPRKPLPLKRLSEIALIVDTGGVYQEE